MTTTREPSDASLYFARIARAYPSLSAYSAASLATELCAIERAQRRHAERCCSGSDGGYVCRVSYVVAPPRDSATIYAAVIRHTTVIEHDPEAEERAAQRVVGKATRFRIRLGELVAHSTGAAEKDLRTPFHTYVGRDFLMHFQGDPRGRVLLVRFPGESEAS